jgi:predicted O-methyltransferase YrrM
MAVFTTDWVTSRHHDWVRWLAHLAGRPWIRGLEIGTFEGRSAIWFLRQILTDPTSDLICIDPRPKPCWQENLARYGPRVRLIKESSHLALRDREFSPESFDFAYLDGSHRACHVLEDAVLVFRLLKPGGIMIFDDYRWQPTRPALDTPKLAIDAFLGVFQKECTLLHRGYQVAIGKNEHNSKIDLNRNRTTSQV